MKLSIKGLVHSVSKVVATDSNKFYKQWFVLFQPERKDDFDRPIGKPQFFKIEILSKDEKDSRFIPLTDLDKMVLVLVDMRGRFYEEKSTKEIKYFIELNLLEYAPTQITTTSTV